MLSFTGIFTAEFYGSAAGIITIAAAIFLAMAGLAAVLKKRRRFSVRTLTYSALCVALALVLSQIKLFQMPQGGSVSAFGMLPIILVGYWFGPGAGMLAGVSHGLLELAFGPYIVHPAQLLLDYPLAFGITGVAGFFRKMKYGLAAGCVAGAAGKLLMHFLSGYIFFGQYAPEGTSPALYSLVYNLSYVGPELLMTLAVALIPAVRLAIGKIKAD